MWCKWCGCGVCDVLCDNTSPIRQCEAIVNKGNTRTQCKRPGKHFNDVEKRYYCERHFAMKEYLEQKYPSERRDSQSKRNSFIMKFNMDNCNANRPMSVDRMSGSSSEE